MKFFRKKKIFFLFTIITIKFHQCQKVRWGIFLSALRIADTLATSIIHCIRVIRNWQFSSFLLSISQEQCIFHPRLIQIHAWWGENHKKDWLNSLKFLPRVFRTHLFREEFQKLWLTCIESIHVGMCAAKLGIFSKHHLYEGSILSSFCQNLQCQILHQQQITIVHVPPNENYVNIIHCILINKYLNCQCCVQV